MNTDSLLNKMEHINAIADALFDILVDSPKAQALVEVIRYLSSVEIEKE